MSEYPNWQDFYYPIIKIETDDVSEDTGEGTTTDESQLQPPQSNVVKKMKIENYHNSSSNCNSNKRNNNETDKIKPRLLNGEYFEVITEIERKDYKHKQIEVRCKLCKNNATLKGAYGVTSNFLKHLKSVHPKSYQSYIEEKANNSVNNGNNGNLFSSINSTVTGSNNRLAINKTATIQLPNGRVSKDNFDMKILKFLISTRSPLTILENDEFKNLFEGTSIKIMNKCMAMTKLKTFYELINDKIKMEIIKYDYHCITVDIWSYRNVKILIMTCNWLDELFRRQSTVLCCKRFSNENDFRNRINQIINEFYEKFNLNNKIVATVTSNKINYTKEFRQLNINEKFFDNSIEDDHQIILDEIENVNDENFDDKTQLLMPSLLKSSTNIISLIMTVDFIDYFKTNENLMSKNKQIFSKCTQLWIKAKYPEINKTIYEIFGKSINYPNAIKWNSLYYALNDILEIKDLLIQLCETFNIEKFTNDELFYLNELCMIMKPFSDAIDFLENYENSYYGYLIPTIVTIITKLKKLETFNKIIYFKDFIQYLKECLIKRFHDIFTFNSNINDAFVASICCPSIKIRWLNVIQETVKHFDIKIIHELIINLIKKDINEMKYNKIPLPECNQKMNPFFDFDDESECHASITNRVELEYYNYLNDFRMDMSMLNDYPSIKKLFFKYNTSLPSSGSTQKLFSHLEIINTAQRCDLTDEQYEKMIFLKANYSYMDDSIISSINLI